MPLFDETKEIDNSCRDAYVKGRYSASYLGYALSNQEVVIVVGNNPVLIDCFRRGENSLLKRSVIRT